MTWRLILIDFDGVLCDSRSLAIECVEELRLLPRFSLLPSPRECGHFGELYRGELRHALRHFGIADHDAKEFFSAHAGSMRRRAADLSLFDGAEAGLNSLPKGSVAIITSAYGDAVRSILDSSGVDPESIEIVGHEVRETKTNKARTLLAQRGLEVEDAIYVGDMESDILYCNALKLRCVAVAYGYHPRDVLEESGPFALVSSPKELFSLLRKDLVA